jgi:hypothetical protein
MNYYWDYALLKSFAKTSRVNSDLQVIHFIDNSIATVLVFSAVLMLLILNYFNLLNPGTIAGI